VAFEDPDGANLKALLAGRYLYLFGNRVTVKKWEQRHNVSKEASHANTHYRATHRW
jgi:hypothetical protein